MPPSGGSGAQIGQEDGIEKKKEEDILLFRRENKMQTNVEKSLDGM